MRSIVLAFSLLVSGAVAAGELRPFVVGSMAQIEAEHKGQPFVLLFWSLTCEYCPTELKMLAALKQKNPALNLVLVATDTPDESLEIKQRLTHYGLDKVEQWVFADAMQERLRFEIDRHWYGEVPRTYFYDRAQQREMKMGLVERSFVESWLERTTQP